MALGLPEFRRRRRTGTSAGADIEPRKLAVHGVDGNRPGKAPGLA
jgi:hypothetical protein